MANEIQQSLDDSLKEILLTSILEMRKNKESELFQKFNAFEQQYLKLKNNHNYFLNQLTSLSFGSLRSRGNELNALYFSAESQRAVAKLKTFVELKSKQDKIEFLKLQQYYEELDALILQLPMPVVLCMYKSEDGTQYPIFSKNFADYSDYITNKYYFNQEKNKYMSQRNVATLSKEYFLAEERKMKTLQENSQDIRNIFMAFNEHYAFYSGILMKYSKNNARQSNISEAFAMHFASKDFTATDISSWYLDSSILSKLKDNTLPHFDGVAGMWRLYHAAKTGIDPTFTGQDVITQFVNMQVKSMMFDPKKGVTFFDAVKISLIENFYLFVKTVLLDEQIPAEEAATQAVLFFKQEDKGISASEIEDIYLNKTIDELTKDISKKYS